MPEARFILCRACNAAHRVSAFDRAPLFNHCNGELRETNADDWRQFMAAHAGHRLEPWQATGRSYFPTGTGATDPMARGYVEITDGAAVLLLQRTRTSIQEPPRYRPVEGRLVIHSATLEIQERALRKELERHFDWAPAAPFGAAKIEKFLRCYRRVLASVEPQELEPRYYPAGDDNAAQAAVDERLARALIAACQTSFTDDEMIALRRFIAAHGDADDVLAPLVCRRAGVVFDSAAVESLPA